MRMTQPHGDRHYSAGGGSQGARKRKAIAEANAEKSKAEKERDELRGGRNILEAHLSVV